MPIDEPHPSQYELLYHDGMAALRSARDHLASARRQAEIQSDADGAFEWGLIFKEILGHMDAALERAELSGDPVTDHARNAPVRQRTGTD